MLTHPSRALHMRRKRNQHLRHEKMQLNGARLVKSFQSCNSFLQAHFPVKYERNILQS